VEGASRIAGKLSFVDLIFKFEILEYEFFIFLDRQVLLNIDKNYEFQFENTFLTNFRDLSKIVDGN